MRCFLAGGHKAPNLAEGRVPAIDITDCWMAAVADFATTTEEGHKTRMSWRTLIAPSPR